MSDTPATQGTTVEATAAAAGASATERFREKHKPAAAVGQDRVSTLATAAVAALHQVIRDHHVTYEEYDALKAWLIQVGEDGEWPLFLDVWIEHVVEEVASADRKGSKGTIEGPYYVPGAPVLPADATLPMREAEPGTPLVIKGQVTGLDGTPLRDAVVEIWHADDNGLYAQFAPGLPEWNLRGHIKADEGTFRIRTVMPAPYQIPTDGSCGRLIAAAGWHAWRPAHFHAKVSAPGHLPITTQLYFRDGPYISTDIASAVKPELILDPVPAADGAGSEVACSFVLDPA